MKRVTKAPVLPGSPRVAAAFVCSVFLFVATACTSGSSGTSASEPVTSTTSDFGYTEEETQFVNGVFDDMVLTDYFYDPSDSNLINAGEDFCEALSEVERPTSDDFFEIVGEISKRWDVSEVESMTRPNVTNGPSILATVVGTNAVKIFCREHLRALN